MQHYVYEDHFWSRGKPGSGKTSLAYALAYQLKLGPVLKWPITARTSLLDGLYRYDAIARLQESRLQAKDENPEENQNPEEDIGSYITLGPLGTAFFTLLFTESVVNR